MSDEQPPREPFEAPAQIPPPPPVQFSAGGASTQAGRPVAATVIGIVLLVFAGIGLISEISNIVMLFIAKTASAVVQKDAVIHSAVIAAVTIPAQVIIGIGLLRMRPWARKGAIVVLIALFVISAINTTLVFSQQDLTAGMPVEAAPYANGIMIGSVIIGLLFSLGINGLMIFFLTRPNVVQAFKEKGE